MTEPPPPPEQPRAPQPGWGQAPPPPPLGDQVPLGTNGFAIAALVLGVIGLCFPFIAALGLVFGFVARKQIRETRQQGDGMAIAGIVLGSIGVAIFLLLLVLIAGMGMNPSGP